ncbi:MAG: peptidoglycan DD-metalloendopeptidase family protein [Pseudomonadota bacterium]
MIHRLIKFIFCIGWLTTNGMAVATQVPMGTAVQEEVLDKYTTTINTLALQLNAAKEHRTAIITRMGDIDQQLDNLQARIDAVIAKQPTLQKGINNIESQIIRIGNRIDDTDKTIFFIANQLDNLPTPTLWEDALGKSPQKRRQRAVKEYQLFKTRNQLVSLQQQQQHLVASRTALFDSFGGVEEAIAGIANERKSLEQKGRDLETLFVDLSADIVQMQDRHSQLENRLNIIKASPQEALFSTAQGRLPDPTAGQLRHTYAEPKAQGLLQWEGIVIDAPLGQEISVVFDGSVVFADHMQGLGNVAIVDHGEGFMSLYGMTDFLIVEPGQIVLAGDTIGTVGQGVGNDEPSLYFEIRQDANTLDPAEWLEFLRILNPERSFDDSE